MHLVIYKVRLLDLNSHTASTIATDLSLVSPNVEQMLETSHILHRCANIEYVQSLGKRVADQLPIPALNPRPKPICNTCYLTCACKQA